MSWTEPGTRRGTEKAKAGRKMKKKQTHIHTHPWKPTSSTIIILGFTWKIDASYLSAQFMLDHNQPPAFLLQSRLQMILLFMGMGLAACLAPCLELALLARGDPRGCGPCGCSGSKEGSGADLSCRQFREARSGKSLGQVSPWVFSGLLSTCYGR